MPVILSWSYLVGLVDNALAARARPGHSGTCGNKFGKVSRIAIV